MGLHWRKLHRQNFIGAGAYCPQTKAEWYVNSGGVGMTNTINRAELTGIAAALTNKYTQIASDSACSLSQIRKQVLFPEMQRDHIHSNLLEQIVSIFMPHQNLSASIKWKPIVALPKMNVQMQLPNTLPYKTEVMTCTFSLRIQTVMHTHTFTGMRLKTPMWIPAEEGRLH